MANVVETKQVAAEATISTKSSILEQAINATKQTERHKAEDLLRALTQSALKGTVTYDKSLVSSLTKAIKAIDMTISKQLAMVMHHEKFKKLEGSWRGLHHLVHETETNTNMRIKIFNASKRELAKDLNKAVEFDQSQLFKKLYEYEFGMPGGEPYGILVGDYEFSHHPEELEMLQHISAIAAAAFCPFISAASSKMFGFDTWSELSKPRDLEKIFDTVDYEKWRNFRESEDSRFVALTLPRALVRLPYGAATLSVDTFDFEETGSSDLATHKMHHDDYCWMNAAYAMAANITRAQSMNGFATAIRGAEGGGKVECLPLHTFLSDDGDPDFQCPTEIGITDRREAELSKLGFLPLCHYKNTDYSVFFGGQSVQKPKKYDRPEGTANAAISARIPYLLATSRFAHYLKVMGRDKIGSFMEVSDVDTWLNRWILGYVNGNAGTKQELKSKYPLAAAKVEVKEVPGQPGVYHAIAWLRPWLQMEELTASLRLVAKIPQLGK